MFTHVNVLTKEIIGAAIEVHRHLGPGLLESAYLRCLSRELCLKEIPFKREWPLALGYKGIEVGYSYRLDLLVGDAVVVEIKSVGLINPIHKAQVLTYLKLGGWKVGLLINFNVEVLKSGIHRIVLGLEE